jgi:hypothetical protein
MYCYSTRYACQSLFILFLDKCERDKIMTVLFSVFQLWATYGQRDGKECNTIIHTALTACKKQFILYNCVFEVHQYISVHILSTSSQNSYLLICYVNIYDMCTTLPKITCLNTYFGVLKVNLSVKLQINIKYLYTL